MTLFWRCLKEWEGRESCELREAGEGDERENEDEGETRTSGRVLLRV
jgi:hypothetical protein